MSWYAVTLCTDKALGPFATKHAAMRAAGAITLKREEAGLYKTRCRREWHIGTRERLVAHGFEWALD